MCEVVGTGRGRLTNRGLHVAVHCAGPAGDTFVNHPRHRLDEVIHSPVRLSVMAALRAADQVHFSLLRDTVGAGDSLLSKHVSALDKAGYIQVSKGYVGKKPRTWYALTDEGAPAFDYVATLHQVVGDPVDPA